MVKVEVRGMNQLKAKLDRLPKVLEAAVWDANYTIAETVRSNTVREIQSTTKVGTGEIANDYKAEVSRNRNGRISAFVWGNPVAMAREFGTGQVGQASPKQYVPKNMTLIYHQIPWFIPAEEAPDLNALYGMPLVKIKGKKFYRTTGQPARQALLPAVELVKKQVPKIYKANVKKQLKSLGG